MSNFGKDNSKFKMVVYLKNGKRLCYYSLTNEEKKGDVVAINGMVRRLLDKAHKGKYSTALIYNTKSDIQLRKYVNGNLQAI